RLANDAEESGHENAERDVRGSARLRCRLHIDDGVGRVPRDRGHTDAAASTGDEETARPSDTRRLACARASPSMRSSNAWPYRARNGIDANLRSCRTPCGNSEPRAVPR